MTMYKFHLSTKLDCKGSGIRKLKSLSIFGGGILNIRDLKIQIIPTALHISTAAQVQHANIITQQIDSMASQLGEIGNHIFDLENA